MVVNHKFRRRSEGTRVKSRIYPPAGGPSNVSYKKPWRDDFTLVLGPPQPQNTRQLSRHRSSRNETKWNATDTRARAPFKSTSGTQHKKVTTPRITCLQYESPFIRLPWRNHTLMHRDWLLRRANNWIIFSVLGHRAFWLPDFSIDNSESLFTSVNDFDFPKNKSTM